MINIRINGTARRLRTAPEESLLSVLHEEFGLTGTPYGCGEGRCGACTVLVDGHAVRACVTSVGEVAGSEVTTVEGLNPDLVEAFADRGMLPCGHCVTGMILTALAADGDMRANECRCNAHAAAVDHVAKTLRLFERNSEPGT